MKKGSVSVAHSRDSPGLLPKMWPQCSWNIYIFPDNWTASILEQHCWCNENVFRSHLYSCVVAIVSSSLPLSYLAFMYCRTKYISLVCSPCKGDMEYCFKFYMLGLTFLFPWHYSDTEYTFPRHARGHALLIRSVSLRSLVSAFVRLCASCSSKMVERNVVCEVSLFLSEWIHS